MARRALVLGTQHLSRGDLEELRDAGQMVEDASSGWRRSPTTSPSRAGDHRLGRRPRRFPGPARGQGSSCEAYDQVARHNADRPVDVNITPRRGLPWMTTAPRACLKHSGSPAQGSWRRRSQSCSARSGPHRPPGRSAPPGTPPARPRRTPRRPPHPARRTVRDVGYRRAARQVKGQTDLETRRGAAQWIDRPARRPGPRRPRRDTARCGRSRGRARR